MNQQKFICPVCGMEGKNEITSKYQGKDYHFCCPECKKKFEENPSQYIK